MPVNEFDNYFRPDAIRERRRRRTWRFWTVWLLCFVVAVVGFEIAGFFMT
jgi:hypothetical protein